MPAAPWPDARQPHWVAAFNRFNHWYLRRHFDALRLLVAHPAPVTQGPTVVYCNHPGWWDPLVMLWLARHFYPRHAAYGPMDAAALARYPLFKKFGIFGVRRGLLGARDFLHATRHILSHPGSMLWLTAQGTFADPRLRPLVLQPGLAHLPAQLAGTVTYIPLALEYPFGTERQPDIRAAFGPPITAPSAAHSRTLLADLTSHLSQLQDQLAAASLSAEAARFTTLWHGSRRSYHA